VNRHRFVTAAIAVACAFAVLSAPGLVAGAYAAPGPPAPTSSPSAVAPPTVGMAPGYVPAGQQPRKDGKTLQDVRLEIDGLYRKAATATDAYNLAQENVTKQSAEIVGLARELVDGQLRIDKLKSSAGATARAQYRSGGLPPEAQLVLTSDPGSFLDGIGRMRQGQKATTDLLTELTRAQDDLKTYAADASTQWQRLEDSRAKKETAKKEITEQIAAAKKLEAGLAKDERARLLQLEKDAASSAQLAWLGSGAVKDINRKASPEGKKAIQFAMEQVGKPYVWGAEGPSSYDCSGLTSQAWIAAGRNIPRTSQEQWRLLPRVALKDIRPGDLIVYFQDASHVAMYVGDGMIVQAPRPGRNVTLAGAGTMRILGVVRPDK
jgi:cell wall-associated NlpC family hydrolase